MNSNDVISVKLAFGTTAKALWQDRYTYTATGQVEYHGMAPRGTTEQDHKWVIERFTYDDSNRVISVQTAPADSPWTGYAGHTYA